MAEGPAGLENQEGAEIKAPVVKEPVSVTQAESPQDNNQPKKSLLKELKACVSGEINFEKSTHIVEYVDRAKVEELVDQIAAFYSVPQNVKENGLKIEMFVVKDDSFARMQKELVRVEKKNEIEALTTEEDREKLVTEKSQCTEGTVLALGSTESKFILIREKPKLDRKNVEIHEIIHTIPGDEDGSLPGFKEGNMWNNINEAATEILTLHFQYPDLNIEDLYGKVYNFEIHCGYEDAVETMLLMMLRTEYNKRSFDFKELAKYYFHDAKIENGTFTMALIKEISSRTMPELQRDTFRCLSADLNRKTEGEGGVSSESQEVQKVGQEASVVVGTGSAVASSEKPNISESLPDKLKIKDNIQLTSALWSVLPIQLREKILQKTEYIAYPNMGVAIGDGKVKPSQEENGSFNVNIGPCFNKNYYAEIFYHEINHVVESVISEEARDKIKNAAGILHEELKSKGIMVDTGHLLIDILPLYLLHPQALNKLSSLYKGWDMAAKVYGELLGEIPSQKRKEIFQEIENIKTTPTSSVSTDADAFLEAIRKEQERGYLLMHYGFDEVKDLLQVANKEG